MTFWIIVVAVNLVLHGIAVAAMRRPLATDTELAAADPTVLSEEHARLVQTLHDDLSRRGFRWFGLATVKTWRDKPAQPAAIWWNGDLGAWVTFESVGRKWSLELSADLLDGSMMSVSRVPVAHLALPPGAVAIGRSRIRSVDDLFAALPVPLVYLPTRRGWPGPGQEWWPSLRRRQLMLDHWVRTGRASPTADGRGLTVTMTAANTFVFLGGLGTKQVVQARANRRAEEHLHRLSMGLPLAPAH